MIDLSFLTEEEQEMILAVLKRDAELKKSEERRVKNLQKSLHDKGRLKYLTGEWFYETKSQRHRDRIHGSDIIMASMRQTRKPVTIFELAQMWPERPSFVSSDNRDVHVPPELSGLIQEPHIQLSNERDQNRNPHEETQEMFKPVLQSSAKQRQNPFNSEPLSPLTLDTLEKDIQPVKEPEEQTKTPSGEPLSSSDSGICHATDLKRDSPENSPVTLDASVQMPIPKKRTVILRSQDSLPEVDGLAGRQADSASQRGILKNTSSSSSTDSLCSWLPPHGPVSLDVPTETTPATDREPLSWIDRKQVRFSSAFGKISVEWHARKELGESSLLDVDCVTPPAEKNTSDSVLTSNTTADTRGPFLKQRQVDVDEGDVSLEGGAHLENQDAGPLQVPGDQSERHSAGLLSSQVSNPLSADQGSGKPVDLETGTQEDGHSQARDWFNWVLGHGDKPQPKLPKQPGDKLEIPVEAASDTKPSSDASSKTPSHAVSPKPRKRLLGIFSRGEAKEKSPELQIPDKEELKLKQKDLGDDILNLSNSQSAKNTQEDYGIKSASLKREATSPGTSEVRTQQLTALQTTQFRETVTILISDSEEFQQELSKDRVANFSNKFSLWDKGNQSPEPLSAREEYVQHGANNQTRHEDIPQVEIEDSHRPQNVHNDPMVAERENNDPSPQTELSEHCGTDGNAPQSNEEVSSPWIGSGLLLDLPKEDGTYRASPILICEETDDSDSQIIQPLENVTNPLPASPSRDTSKQQRDIPVPLPRQSSPQESRSTKINDLKSLWEKEHPGPMTFAGRVKEATSTCSSSVKSPVNLNQKIATSHSDLRTSESSMDKVGEEVQRSSLYRIKSVNIVPTTKDIRVSEKGFVSQSCQQYQLKTNTSVLSQQRPLSPTASPSRLQTPRSRDSSDDELRRSPSKTCHPKALPRESSGPNGSRLEGSPLKTFPIDIAQPTKDHEKQLERPMPAARQRKSPSHEAKQLGSVAIKPGKELNPCPPLLQSEGYEKQQQEASEHNFLDSTQSLPKAARDTHSGSVNIHQSSPTSSTEQENVSESVNTGQPPTKRDFDEQKQPGSLKQSGTFTRLARSFIPQNSQHYLGSPERAHRPPFHREKAVEKSNVNLSPPAPSLDAGHRPQSLLRDCEEPQSQSADDESHSRISSWFVQNVDGVSGRDDTSRDCSRSRASSGSELLNPIITYSHDDSSPFRLALNASKPVSSSKSLENLTSQPAGEERGKNDQRGPLNLSVDDVSALPRSASTPSDPERMKNMSVSVPVFQQEERDSDCMSEDNLNVSWRRNTGSSVSNISISSGMASMSSVSGSVTSIPAVFGDIIVQGTVQFAMNYVQKLGEFHIFVVHCRDLAVAEPKKNRSDPYVKCYLLPDKTKLGKRKTSVKRKTLNPNYNEILRFKITMKVLKTQILNISVWHNDNFGRNCFLGEVDLDLSEWNFSNTQMNDYALKARASAQVSTLPPSSSESMDKSGEMRVSLRFLPQMSHSKRTSKMETGEVQIWVKDCKNLPPVRGLIIDPFVKCTVLPDTSRRSRQKTRVVKRTANPMFNHTMVYDGFRPEDLREACVEITVWDHDRLHNHYIGGLRLGLGTGKSYGAEVGWMDSTTAEARLWERMMQSHSEWVEDVIPLRMLLMAKGMSK